MENSYYNPKRTKNYFEEGVIIRQKILQDRLHLKNYNIIQKFNNHPYKIYK